MKRNYKKYIKLIHFLSDKVGYCCEICGKNSRADWRGLSGCHIIRKSRGIIAAPDKAWNILMACGVCHDHNKYPKRGYEMSEEEALEIARLRNEKLQIDPEYEG